MKTTLTLLVALCAALPIWAQAPYSPEQLDQLVGPIALYPDPLIALILPASTAPSDITLAARYLAANGAPAGIDSQPWDPSVKGLAHYPQLVQWMDDNLAWTQALGTAFAEQPADVMKSIQQMRAQALAAGTLVDTPQQQVDEEGDDIRIIPAQPDQIYVPEYDPDYVYGEPGGYAGPFLTFGIGYPVGPWLEYECDWDDFGIWIGPFAPGWAYRRDWTNRTGNPWRLDPSRWRGTGRNIYAPNANLPRPSLVGKPAQAPRGGGLSGTPRAQVVAPSSRPDYRGYSGPPAAPAPSGGLIGGYDRGTDTRAESSRGVESRAAPVKSPAPPPAQRAPAPAPAPADRERH